jgi:hypothetical protein
MAHTRVAAPSSCLPRTLITAGGKHCPHSIHTQHPPERKPELCRRNPQFTNPKRAQTLIMYTQHPIYKSQRTHTHTHTHTRGGGSKWRVQERLREWALSRNCGCEWGSRQVSTISDAGTRYALRLSQIQEYYSVDLSVSVSVSGSLGVFITYVQEGFFSL